MRFLPILSTQRAYLASHPLAFWLAVGIALTGYINLFAPSLTGETASSVVFSSFVLFLFNIAWAGGGTFVAVGLLRGRPKIEGAGQAVLASALFSYFLAVIAARPSFAATALFILCLGVGCAFRAVHLATHGYVVLDVPTDQPGLK